MQICLQCLWKLFSQIFSKDAEKKHLNVRNERKYIIKGNTFFNEIAP